VSSYCSFCIVQVFAVHIVILLLKILKRKGYVNLLNIVFLAIKQKKELEEVPSILLR